MTMMMGKISVEYVKGEKEDFKILATGTNEEQKFVKKLRKALKKNKDFNIVNIDGMLETIQFNKVKKMDFSIEELPEGYAELFE